MNMNWKKLTSEIVFAALLIVCSYSYLDKKIALVLNSVLTSNNKLAAVSANIPDLLFLIVVAVTGAAWIAYSYGVEEGITNINTRFFLLIANAVPFSFLLKSILQFVIGRNSTRHWLSSPGVAEFHWFRDGGFPSGHMAVFTVIVIALCKYYPRYRLAFRAFLLSLALVLIATNYHFLSDVIAGVYLGRVVHHCTLCGIAFFSEPGKTTGVVLHGRKLVGEEMYNPVPYDDARVSSRRKMSTGIM